VVSFGGSESLEVAAKKLPNLVKLQANSGVAQLTIQFEVWYCRRNDRSATYYDQGLFVLAVGVEPNAIAHELRVGFAASPP
jgi:hypothetical protein